MVIEYIEKKEILLMFFSYVEKNAEKVTGLSLRQIKDFNPSEYRAYLKKKNKKQFSFVSVFPVIGRGNVLKNSLVSSKDLNAEVDRLLG